MLTYLNLVLQSFVVLLTLLAVIATIGYYLLWCMVLPKKIHFDLRNKHALITGGSKGIGRCIAAELLRASCKTISIVARDPDALEKARQELLLLCSPDQSVRVYSFDVAQGLKEVKTLIQTVEEDSGPVDLLVNNAGTCLQGAVEDLPDDAFESQMKTNFFSAVNFTRAVLPQMKARNNGHISFVSSAAGQCAIWGYTAYSPSKFALRAFADALKMELTPFGIGVSVLFPPNTNTEGFEEEQRCMPDQIREIGASAGLFPPQHVAAALVNSIRDGEYWTCVGLDGQLLGLLTAGASPEPNPTKAIAQILFAGPIRAIMLIYSAQFASIIQKYHNKKKDENDLKERKNL